MGDFAICIIGGSLAMDATAMAITNGITNPNLSKQKKIAIAFCFAFFQGLMPILGFYFSKTFIHFIDAIDNIIVFFILLFLSIKMIISSFKKKEVVASLKYSDILYQGIITSIDALMIGSIFLVFKYKIYKASLIIFLITLVFTFFGVSIGCKLGKHFDKGLEIIGGIILLFLAVKSLLT